MKPFVFTLVLLVVPIAQAGTLTPLTVPPDVLRNGYTSCVGTAVGTGDVISGWCQSVANRPYYRNSYIYTFSAVQWDDAGNILNETYCGQELTAGIFASYTYQPAYNSSSCVPPWHYFSGLNDMLIGNQWYGYVTTAGDGTFELVLNGHYGTVFAF